MHRPTTLQDAIDKMKMALSNKMLILGKPSGVLGKMSMTKTLVDLGETFDKVQPKVPLIVGKVNSQMWEVK